MANKNRIAYAICSAHGIDTTGMSPKEAWEKAKEVADKNELADLTQDSPKETKKEEPKEEKVDYNALRMGKKQDEGEQKVDYNAKRLGKNDKVADEFSYEGKENDIKKLKQAGFNVDSGYSSGNTFEIFDKDTGDYNKINIGKNGKYFSAVISGTVYTYKDLETAIDRATYKSGKAPSQGAIGWENGGYDSETYDNYMKEVWFGKKEQPTTSNDEPIDYENIEYPKGTSKKYTKYVNEQFEDAKPILEKAGIKLEDFGGKPSKEGGYEDNTKEIMNKYVFEPFRKKYPNGNNDVYEKEYQPLYDAIEAVADKNYNDWYIRNNKK